MKIYEPSPNFINNTIELVESASEKGLENLPNNAFDYAKQAPTCEGTTTSMMSSMRSNKLVGHKDVHYRHPMVSS
jgi:hypothetical protein